MPKFEMVSAACLLQPISVSLSASSREASDAERQHQAQCQPVPEVGKGCHAFVGLHLAVQGSADAALGVDDGGHPRIGCPQHGAAGFGGAHLGDLQMLRLGQRAPEPRGVREIGQDAGLRQGADDLFAEDVFVADVGREALPLRTISAPTTPRRKATQNKP